MIVMLFSNVIYLFSSKKVNIKGRKVKNDKIMNPSLITQKNKNIKAATLIPL